MGFLYGAFPILSTSRFSRGNITIFMFFLKTQNVGQFLKIFLVRISQTKEFPTITAEVLIV